MKIAVIPGDGIGPEVIDQAVRTLHEVAPAIETSYFDLGARNYRATGRLLDRETLHEIRQHDAILLGAIGDPTVPAGTLERGILLEMRFALDHHINLRPTKTMPGAPRVLAGDANLDLLVVREGTEGPYTGNGGALRVGTPYEVATEVSVNTRFGVDRLLREAFERAAVRRQRVTIVHKPNVLAFAGSLWTRAADELATLYPEVEVDHMLVDAAMLHLVTNPARFDVIATDNLFGDLITDLTSALGGGVGLAASANIDGSRRNPAMFEPVHGSAPDIAGRGVADPTAAILSTALMLHHLGLSHEANTIDQAVRDHVASRGQQSCSTEEIGEQIRSRVGSESLTPPRRRPAASSQ
ncbi:3-isopropylmalate dehydrogenase [Rhodococcus wratislaviensis]|uniref:3-isopropylmalate dehydrogenase n=1 Tax=Rhodococcus wratislaviensis NBRC 100605 TaxID=1219028 RepID=X0RCE7_RHOWR|nr:3-isopropylmalate dehydrogenase [Rhodococcus wratislaviensis]GAF48710.1 3-isopropylmalate dehydrogenase [Rhodococcus wratislaviensis NBRC 100605]